MGGGRHKPGMARLRTVWITEPSRETFKSQHQITQELGKYGSLGKLYRCTRKKDKQILSVKVIPKASVYRVDRSDQRRQALLKAMQAEIDIMRRLKHKYIMTLYGCFENKHTLHIVMEECEGESLFDRICKKCKI